MNRKLLDLSGHRFGRLVVIDRAGNDRSGSATWIAKCDCGAIRTIAGTHLRAGRHKSCGCASPRFTSERVRTHGKTHTRTYGIWLGMRARCANADGPSARNYALKGIRVCDRWQDFNNFLADMGECPDGLTIDRLDNAKGYEPSNCRWATRQEQGNNTSANRVVEYEGRSQNVSQWAAEIGVKPNTLLYRLRRGWAVARALNVTIGRLAA